MCRVKKTSHVSSAAGKDCSALTFYSTMLVLLVFPSGINVRSNIKSPIKSVHVCCGWWVYGITLSNQVMTSRSHVFKPRIYFELAVQRNTLKIIFRNATDCIAFYIFACAHASICTCSECPNKHSGPVWQLRWIQQALSLTGEEKAEVLFSVAADGRISKWFLCNKGLDCIGTMPVILRETVVSENPRTHTFLDTQLVSFDC